MFVVAKNLPANAGDVGSIPGWRRSPGEVNGNPLQYSCLGNMDRGRVGHDLVTKQQQTNIVCVFVCLLFIICYIVVNKCYSKYLFVVYNCVGFFFFFFFFLTYWH